MKLSSVTVPFLLCTLLFAFECDGQPASTQSVLKSDFTPSEEYDKDFIELVEMVYGEGILSQGGIAAIDEMFQGYDLEGLTLLDLGCGLGMHDIHLARKHHTRIIGIDPQEHLIGRANVFLDSYSHKLAGSVEFQHMQDPANLGQFPDSSFDLIFSKEALLHVPYDIKDAYFKEIHRVLKPGGAIVIMDWMHASACYTEATRRMMEMDGIVFQLLTPNDYSEALAAAGFADIHLKDTTSLHAAISQENIETILSLEKEIKAKFGEEVYLYALESWTCQRDAFLGRELLTGIFYASKQSR